VHAPQREWLEAQQQAQQQGGGARPQWPQRIFENFYVVVGGWVAAWVKTMQHGRKTAGYEV
jgi:hypothetical protein